MLIPMVLPVPCESKTLEHRISQIEKAVSHSIAVMPLITAILEEKFGRECIPSALQSITSEISATALNKVLCDIDSACQDGDKPAAVRQIRTALACTWDEANQIVKHWNSYSAEQKLSWLRIGCFIKSVEA